MRMGWWPCMRMGRWAHEWVGRLGWCRLTAHTWAGLTRLPTCGAAMAGQLVLNPLLLSNCNSFYLGAPPAGGHDGSMIFWLASRQAPQVRYWLGEAAASSAASRLHTRWAAAAGHGKLVSRHLTPQCNLRQAE